MVVVWERSQVSEETTDILETMRAVSRYYLDIMKQWYFDVDGRKFPRLPLQSVYCTLFGFPASMFSDLSDPLLVVLSTGLIMHVVWP